MAVILVFCGILGSCSDTSSNNEYTKYGGYSKTYQNDAEYRNNVKNIADAYGVSEREVDEKINAVTGGK